MSIYCYLIADFLQNFYRNVPWVVLYQTYLFCYNRLTNIKKSTSQKLCGDKAETLQCCF